MTSYELQRKNTVSVLHIRFLKQVKRYFRLSCKVFGPPAFLNTRNEYIYIYIRVKLKYTVSLHMCGGIYFVLSSNTLSIGGLGCGGVGGALGGLGGPGGLGGGLGGLGGDCHGLGGVLGPAV